jgi:hypothetical protein
MEMVIEASRARNERPAPWLIFAPSSNAIVSDTVPPTVGAMPGRNASEMPLVRSPWTNVPSSCSVTSLRFQLATSFSSVWSTATCRIWLSSDTLMPASRTIVSIVGFSFASGITATSAGKLARMRTAAGAAPRARSVHGRDRSTSSVRDAYFTPIDCAPGVARATTVPSGRASSSSRRTVACEVTATEI